MPSKWKQFFIIEIPVDSYNSSANGAMCIVYCVWCGMALWKINIHESYVEILTFNKKWNIKSLNTPEKNWIESNRGRRNLETDQIGCYGVEKKQVSHRWETLYI